MVTGVSRDGVDDSVRFIRLGAGPWGDILGVWPSPYWRSWA